VFASVSGGAFFLISAHSRVPTDEVVTSFSQRAPAKGIGEHSVETFRDARQRRGEALLAEEPCQQRDYWYGGCRCLDFARHGAYPLATDPGAIPEDPPPD